MRLLVGCFLRCFSGWTTDSSVRYGGLYPSRIFTVLGMYWFSLQAIPVVFWDRISMPSPSIHTCDRFFLSGLTGPLAGECHTFPWRLHPRKESPAKVTVSICWTMLCSNKSSKLHLRASPPIKSRTITLSLRTFSKLKFTMTPKDKKWKEKKKQTRHWDDRRMAMATFRQSKYRISLHQS